MGTNLLEKSLSIFQSFIDCEDSLIANEIQVLSISILEDDININTVDRYLDDYVMEVGKHMGDKMRFIDLLDKYIQNGDYIRNEKINFDQLVYLAFDVSTSDELASNCQMILHYLKINTNSIEELKEKVRQCVYLCNGEHVICRL